MEHVWHGGLETYAWMLFGANLIFVIVYVVCSLIVCYGQVKRNIWFLHPYLSKQNFLILALLSQYWLNYTLFFRYLCVSFFSFCSSFVSVILLAFTHRLSNVIFVWQTFVNFIPLLLVWIVYFVFKHFYTNKISVQFLKINNDIEVFKNAHLVNHKKFDLWLHFQINKYWFFWALYDQKNRWYELMAPYWFYQFFFIWACVAGNFKPNEVLRISQSEITLAQLLKKIDVHLNEYDTQINLRHRAKYGCFQKYAEQYLNKTNYQHVLAN